MPTVREKNLAKNKALGLSLPKETYPTASKPSPTSVTGVPKTNANNNISGVLKSPTAGNSPINQPITQTTNKVTNAATPRSPIYDSNYVSNKYTKPQADQIYNQKLEQTKQQVATPGAMERPIASNLDEAEAIRVSRGQIGAKPENNAMGADITGGDSSSGNSSNTGMQPTGEGGLMMDDGSKMLKDATDEYTKGLDDISKGFEKSKLEEYDSIEREYQAKKASLDEAEKIMIELNNRRMDSINVSTAAQKQEVEAAYQKQKEAIDLQKKQTAQAYKDMQISKELANKRRMVEKETAMGLLGGAYTSAGVADIQDVIMQGENELLSLSKQADLEDQKFTNDLNGLYNDYKTDNLKIEQYKTDSINASYSELQQAILSIQQSEVMAVQDKEQAIREAASRYNDKISQISAEAVQARYNLAKDTIARADMLKAAAQESQKNATDITNKERDDARSAIQNLMTTLPAESFGNLNDSQKLQLRTLEQKAGYPQGLLEQGFKTMKELSQEDKTRLQDEKLKIQKQLADLKAAGMEVSSTQTDENGNVTGVVYDKMNNSWTTISLGNIGKQMAPYSFMMDLDGNVVANNKFTGSSGMGTAGGMDGGVVASNLEVGEPTGISLPGVGEYALGRISGKYESGNKYDRVSTGAGDAGGKSYGAHQFSSKTGTLNSFLKGSGYAQQFAGLQPGSSQFDARWKQLAQSDPEFSKAQDQYIAKTHYEPMLQKVSAIGLDQKGPAVKEMIFSTGVQYGPKSPILLDALRGKDVASMSDVDIINTVQNYKAKTVNSYFPSSSQAVRSGVANRHANGEKKDLLALVQASGGSSSPEMGEFDNSTSQPSVTNSGEQNWLQKGVSSLLGLNNQSNSSSTSLNNLSKDDLVVRAMGLGKSRRDAVGMYNKSPAELKRFIQGKEEEKRLATEKKKNPGSSKKKDVASMIDSLFD